MARNRASARKAGTAFETLIAAYLREHVDDRIERRRLTGSKDRGDIAGLRHMSQPLAVECKNTTRTDLAGWADEADIARGNSDSLAGVVVSKRHGRGAAKDQWVHMTLEEFVAILNGSRDHTDENRTQLGETQ